MKITGYLTLYIKIECEGDRDLYCRYTSDFKKAPTRWRLRRILKTNKKAAEELGFRVRHVKLITEQEYEENFGETILRHEWGDKEAVIERGK